MSVRCRFSIILVLIALVAPGRASSETAAVGKKKAAKAPTQKTSAQKSSAKSRSRKASSSAAAKARQRKHVLSAAQKAKLRRLQRAFVASSELKPMAKQLLEARSNAGYAAVEKFAKKHADEDAGGLAYLLLGYARVTDAKPDHDRAIADLKNARPHARDLADYVDFYLAQAYWAKSDAKNVVLTLDRFGNRYPDSLLRREAALIHASALMSLKGYEEAADILEAVRKPQSADIELALGKARRALGENDKALQAFRTVYFDMPTNGQAEEAGSLIRQMVGNAPLGTWTERKSRAEALARARQYAQAALEHKQLDQDAPSPALEVALAHNYVRLNRDSDAKKVLLGMDFAKATAEDQAKRLYLLAEIARDENDDGGQDAYIQQLASTAPQSGWRQQALLSIGNKFMLRRDYESALRYYAPAWQEFPRSTNASLLHWRTAWLTYRLNRIDDARQLMEEQVQKYGDSGEAANALYWLGRIAEEQAHPEFARAYYQKLNERFQNYYYALLAQDRLARLGDGSAVNVALLEKIAKADPPSVSDAEGGDDNIRLQKAKLLANAALYDLATRELQTAAADPANADWANAEMIRLYMEAGMPFKALRRAKQAVPSYVAADVSALPRTFAEGLFPRPYWDDLQRSATANGLDPYLVASLIRQESEFNAAAISHANAYGLMQLLPAVGKETAKQIKFKGYSTADLLDPAANLKLGSHYFKAMVDEYNGQVEYALAAYNAGINRVAEWRATSNYRDVAEFVESIPFTETREYVQAILRNRAMYKKIYEGPLGTKLAAKSTD